MTTLHSPPERPQQQPRAARGQPRLATAASAFRPDIEGLRAVAIVAVLLYHAGVPYVQGGYVGVDVFFVISGFLITRLLVKEIGRTGSVALSRFYQRRIRRLLPAAAVALVIVAGLSLLLLSPVEQRAVAGDLVAAGAYVVNWRLANQAVDYFGASAQASPIQHFWSLAVEEQFYIIWPVLLLSAAWLARRTTRPAARRTTRPAVRPAVVLLVAAVAVSSLAYCVLLTRQQPDAAYFSTFARGWEFALGGAAVFVAPRLRRPAAVALGWTGMAAITVSAVWFDETTMFPGWHALLPTAGTGAVLVAGAVVPLRTLTCAPLRHAGRISYSWYLWHWPLVVFAAARWGELSAWQGLLAVAAAWVPSVLSYRFVETPFRESPLFARSRRRTVGLGAACTSVAVAAGLLLTMSVPPVTTKAMSEVRGAHAMQRGEPVQESADGMRPDPQVAKNDWPREYDDGCHVDRAGTASGDCVYGDESSDTTVVLFGDSHAMQYFPALETLAGQRGWRLVALTKSGCPPPDATLYNSQLKREYSECDAWREYSVQRILDEERPALVVASGRSTYSVLDDGERLDRAASTDALENGYVETLRKLRGAGIQVAVIGDNPHPDRDVPKCVSRHPDKLDNCALPRSGTLAYTQVGMRAAEKVEGAHPVDPVPLLCRGEVCPAVIGDVLVYGQTTHLTATYVETMTPWLGKQLPAPS